MKSLINSALLIEQLKRNSLFIVSAMLMYILSILFPLYREANSLSSSLYMVNGRATNMMIDLVSGRSPILILTSIIIIAGVVISHFSYLFTSKATTSMHSYPINRKQLFFTNVVSGLIILIIPVLLLSIALLYPETKVAMDNIWASPALFPNGLEIGQTINTVPVIAVFFFRTVVMIIFYYSLFLLATMISGNAVICLLFMGALPFIPTGIILVQQQLMTFFGFGYVASFELVEKVFTHTNPAMWSTFLGWSNRSISITATEQGNFFTIYGIGYILISVALLVASYFCNRIRPQERAGDSVVFNFLEKISIFLFSVAGMLTISMLFMVTFRTEVSIYIGATFGLILSYIAAHMIAAQSTRVLKKAKKDFLQYASIIAAIYLFFIVFVQLDVTGHLRRTPSAGEVEGIFISEWNRRVDETALITDPQTIADTIALHEALSRNKNSLRGAFLENFTGANQNRWSEMNLQQTHIWYRMKDGRYVMKFFVYPTSFEQENNLSSLHLNEHVIVSQQEVFHIPPQNMLYLTIDIAEITESLEYFDRDDSKSVTITSIDEILSFMEALKKDTIESAHILSQSLTNPTQYSMVSGFLENTAGRSSYFRTSLYTENTLAWLRDNGYLEDSPE